jgi:hypothetical protein
MIVSSETKRPARVTLLILLVLFVTASNGLRFGETIFFWNILAQYTAHPLYITISGGVWFTLGLILLLGILRRKEWTWMAAIFSTILYGIWVWIDRLFLQGPHANWPFALMIDILLVLIVFLVLFSPGTRRFFKRNVHEQKSETPTTARP